MIGKIILALVAIFFVLAALNIIDVQQLLHDAIDGGVEIFKAVLEAAT